MKIALILGLMVANCGSADRATYISTLPEHGESRVELPSPLPEGDFDGELIDPYGKRIPLDFVYFQVDGGACYWSSFLYLCRGNGTMLSETAETPEGLRIRVEGDESDAIYYIYGQQQSSADFSRVRGGELLTFGVIDQATGEFIAKYERRTD